MDLSRLGLPVPAAEQQASSFGPGTLEAVQKFQTEHGLQATGVVDAATAAQLAAVIAASTYTVSGTVSSPVSAGVMGLNVSLVDKYIGPDTPLPPTTTAPTITNRDGSYSISTVITDRFLRDRHKSAPDLQVKVFVGEKFLAQSAVIYNASKHETLDVVLPADASGLASEHETLTAAVQAAYTGRLSDLQEHSAQRDITYLANKTGWDARTIAMAALAEQFSDKASSEGGSGINPGFFYALFRAGLPSDPEALYQTSLSNVQAIWEQSLQQGVIQPALRDELPRAREAFELLSKAHVLDARPMVGLSTLRDMLNVSLDVKEHAKQHDLFAAIYVQHRDDPAAMWTAVEQTPELGKEISAQLQLDGKLFYLTQNNAPLITRLYATEKDSQIKSPLDLIAKGYYEETKWVPLIGTDIPANTAGKTPDDRRNQYAELLAAQIRLSFPTAVAADRVHRGFFPISDTAEIAAGVHDFLTTHQNEFDIGAEPVEAYIQRIKLSGTNPSVVEQIDRLQRVYQITPDDQSMAVLLQNNLDSAYAITRYDAFGFVASMKDKLDSGRAMRIYNRARQISNVVTHVATSYAVARTSPQLGTGQASIINTKPSGDSGVIAGATLEQLFGPMDYCECEDCRSILSPAAYLVDLFHFIDFPSVTPNPQTDVLFKRRPDLQSLYLTCANTNTAMPYIDIVNETLEYFVQHQLSLDGFQGFNTDDSISSAELIAIPQNIDSLAYDILKKASFPPPLPFHQPLQLLRLHLQRIGVTLADVMAALRPTDALERPTDALKGNGATYGWRDILMEQIGLSRDEHTLLTDSTIGLHGLYGYKTEADALANLPQQRLHNFSRRTGISYDDMFSIVQTRFINPNSVLIGLLQQLKMTFAAFQTIHNVPPNSKEAKDFEQQLPQNIDARDYGGTRQSDLTAIVKWVQLYYPRITSIIVYEDTSANPDPCSAANLQLRYTNNNPLQSADFVRLIRFIRLWQKLGLTVEQTDDILAALYPADLATNDEQQLDKGFLKLLPRIGFLYRVMDMLGLSTDSLPQLLACWAPIDTTGANSLYASMFLTTPVQDPAFKPDAAGELFTGDQKKLLDHEPALCAAFNLTGTEFSTIINAPEFKDKTALNLDNISAIFRIGWLAHTLQMSVVEFLALTQYSGLNPFAPLDLSPSAPAEPPAIQFIRMVQAMSAAGLQPVQALYLIWNHDLNGKAAPPDSNVTNLAVALRSVFATVNREYALRDDPDGSIAKKLMAQVYGASATDFFFGLLNGKLTTSTGYTFPPPSNPNQSTDDTLSPKIITASHDCLSYDGLQQELIYAGVLDDTTESAIDSAITNNGNDLNLHAALKSLWKENHQQVDWFFNAYPDLLSTYTSYAASDHSPQNRRAPLLKEILKHLIEERKREQALATITAATGADPSFAAKLLNDVSVLHAATHRDAWYPGVSDLTLLEFSGLTAKFFFSNKEDGNANVVVDPEKTLSYAPKSDNSLPINPGGGLIAGVWSGYLNVPQNDSYSFSVATDPGASVTLEIGGKLIALTQKPATPAPSTTPPAIISAVWTTNNPVSLTAGALVRIKLTVLSVSNNMTLSWQSKGMGWQVIPSDYLYSDTHIANLTITYTTFLKLTSLASALSLTADELAYLANAISSSVNTTDAKDTLTPGNCTFTPESMTNINKGTILIIDEGAAREVVEITATTATTFSAVTRMPHDGTTAAPFPILGNSWFNYLAFPPEPGSAYPQRLREALLDALDFSRIKQALSPTDERLLAILQSPAMKLPDDTLALMTLTGWTQDSVNALLNQFFQTQQFAVLSSFEKFRRVYDAYSVLTTCQLSAKALLYAATNEPSLEHVNTLQSALRAFYADADWFTVVQPINDTMRQAQRDALVAYILQQFQEEPASTPPSPTDGSTIDTADKLLEYFLIDPQTEPAVQTSRIRLALSATQLFIERCMRTLERQVKPELFDKTGDHVDTQGPLFTGTKRSQWEWMKRYRVWQANREVLLWPENWLYPELRDDQSSLFKGIMAKLLQGDITDDAAYTAYLDYLTGLEQIAKLEPCGIYYVPGIGDSNEVSYVVGRTAGAHHKYYFRQLENGSWTSWAEMKIDPEDLPVTPVIWNDRLFVFWLKALKQTLPPGSSLIGGNASRWLSSFGPLSGLSSTQTDSNSGNSSNGIASMSVAQLQSETQAIAAGQQQVIVSAILCYSEFSNGQWQSAKTSDPNFPTTIAQFSAGDSTFDQTRSQLLIRPSILDPGGANALCLKIYIANPQFYTSGGGFVLHNTHSLPVRFEDAQATTPPVWSLNRLLQQVLPYPGVPPLHPVPAPPYDLSINYGPSSAPENHLISSDELFRFVQPSVDPAPLDASPPMLPDLQHAPFFFEDRRNVFYVTTDSESVPFPLIAVYGMQSTGSSVKIPLLVPWQTPSNPGDPWVIDAASAVVNLGQPGNIRNALSSLTTVDYMGGKIGVLGLTAGEGAAANLAEETQR